MNDLQKLTQEILADAFVMNLATTDAAGPWVAPVTYVFDASFNLYWTSDQQVRHSRALLQNPHVACSVIADFSVGSERALQIEGTASPLLENSPELEQMLQMKKANQRQRFLLKGSHRASPPVKSWYKLTPIKIELIHNEKFGYKRQSVL